MSEMGADNMGMPNVPRGPEAENYEPEIGVAEVNSSLIPKSMRTFVAAIGAIFAVSMAELPQEAAAAGRETSISTIDRSKYEEFAKKAIAQWLEKNGKLIMSQAIQMQLKMDDTGRVPEKAGFNIPIPENAAHLFASARYVISHNGIDKAKNPVYKIQFFVTDKQGGDIDSGTVPLTLRKGR